MSALTTATPLVITFRGSDLNHDPGLSRFGSMLRMLLSQLAALRAKRIICVSEQLKWQLWWRKNAAIVIPSGVDTRLFHACDKKQARRQLQWGQDERVVLFNAGANPTLKRINLAMAAVSFAEHSLGAIRLFVLNGDVAQERIPLLMSAADCLLVTSECEGSPNVIKEAIACGLPVVSVEVGDAKLRLANVHPSRIVDRDPVALGNAIAEIIRLGQRSNGATQVEDFSETTVVKRILAVYEAVRL